MRSALLFLIFLPCVAVAQAPEVLRAGDTPAPVEQAYTSDAVPSLHEALASFGGVGARAGGVSAVALAVGAELDNVAALALTPSGALVASGIYGQNVVAQEAMTGAFLWDSGDVCNGPYDVQSAGEVVVATCAFGGDAVVLDAASGALQRRIPLSGQPVRVELSADGALAIVGTLAPFQVIVVETATGVVRTSFDAPLSLTGGYFFFASNRNGLRFTPLRVTEDGARVVVLGFDEVATFDAATGAVVARASLSAFRTFQLELSADGSTALVLTESGVSGQMRGWFYDVETGALSPVELPNVGEFGATGALAPDGSRALVTLRRGATAIVQPGQAPVAFPSSGDVLPLGQGQAALNNESITVFVDLESMTATTGTVGGAPSVNYPTLRPRDGQTVARVTGRLESVAVSRPGSGTATYRLGEGEELDVARFVAASPSGALAAVSLSESGRIGLVDLATSQLVDVLGAGMAAPQSLAFLSETALVVAGGDTPGSGSGSAILARIDLASGEVAELETPPGRSLDAVYVRAGGSRVLARSPVSQRVYVYDLGDDGLTLVADGFIGGSVQTTSLSDTDPKMSVTESGSHVVSLDPFGAGVVVYDVAADQTTTIPFEDQLFAGGVSANGTRALVAGGITLQLIDLSGTPTVVRTRSTPSDVGPVTFDALRGEFVVSNPVSSPSSLIRVSPSTGDILQSDPISAPLFAESLGWTAEAGVVVVGGGTDTAGGILTEADGFLPLSGPPGQLAVVGDQALVAIPGPDVLDVVKARTTDAGERPHASGLRLVSLTSPSARPRVEVRGPARASLRVEVVDALGRVVARLHDGPFAGGAQSLRWHGAAPGSYLVRVAGEPVSARVTVVR